LDFLLQWQELIEERLVLCPLLQDDWADFYILLGLGAPRLARPLGQIQSPLPFFL
jgi:hypothetical protein